MGKFIKVTAVAPFLLVTAVAIFGCNSDEQSGPRSGEKDEKVPEATLRVHPDNSNLAFRFFDKNTGQFATVGAIGDVPDEVKPAVLVFDATTPPPPELIFVADLTSPGPDGTFPYRTENRYRYEDGIVVVPDGTANRSISTVTLYTAEWCGACKQAKRWLQQEKIPFVERDIEKDPKAMGAMADDAKRAGVPFEQVRGGVPVIVAGRQIMKGFDPSSIKRALAN